MKRGESERHGWIEKEASSGTREGVNDVTFSILSRSIKRCCVVTISRWLSARARSV